MEKYIGEKVIVRCENSGVFFGTLAERDGREARITNCRQPWYWEGAASLMQMAAEGVKQPESCKFTVVIPEVVVLDVIEILPCSKAAIKNIEAVPVWKI